MDANLVVAIWKCDAVQCIIDVFTARRVDRADFEVTKIPATRYFLR